MTSDPELLKLLELASQRLQHHHDALWEEEKHYSWWVYIIFAGLIYLYFKLPPVTLLVPWQKALIMGLGSLFGCFISLMGYNVVRREGEFFHKAIQIYNDTAKVLKIHERVPKAIVTIQPQANKSFCELIRSAFLTARDSLCGFLTKCLKKKLNKRKRKPENNLGIRDFFQLTFLITALLFIVFGTFSVLTIN